MLLLKTYCHIFFFVGRLPCCVFKDPRARYVLLLSSFSFHSLNLLALAALVVQTRQQKWQVHEEGALGGGKGNFPCRFLAPTFRCHFPKQTVKRVFTVCSMSSLSAELAACVNTVWDTFPRFSKPAKSRAT